MRPLPLLTALILLGSLGGAAAVASEPPSREAAPERYIVAFTSLPSDRATYLGHGVEAVDEELRFLVVRAHDPDALKVRALHDDRVRYVTRDDPAAASLSLVPNDARYGDAGHYGSARIGAEAAWGKTLGTTAVKVATLDTGINRNHEDFVGGRVLQGYDFVNRDTDPNDQGGACGYHGSHTAGIAGATINNGKGIAGMSQHALLPVKVFGATPSGCTSSTTTLVKALKYAADQGAHVSSNSWGSAGADSAINDAVRYAHGKGTIHVAAAGNRGACTDCVSHPWRDLGDIALVVSATTQDDTFAPTSSEGPQVDLAAPGVGILSVDGATASGYKPMDGTSMAAPYVAGAVALLKALEPALSFAEVEARLKGTALDLGPAGADDRYGAGRLDAGAALALSPDAGAPSAPQALTAAHEGSLKSGKILLRWQAPASFGGSEVTGYRVHRDGAFLTQVGPVLSFTDSGLVKGRTYTYFVTAVNALGASLPSNEASAVG